MKKVGDLMAELGFNKDAPDAAKEGFLKHLIKTQFGINVQTPTEKKQIEESKNVKELPKRSEPDEVAQLCFDLENCI